MAPPRSTALAAAFLLAVVLVALLPSASALCHSNINNCGRCDTSCFNGVFCIVGCSEHHWRLLIPNDVTAECYYNAAIDQWYWWEFVDYNAPGIHTGNVNLYRTGEYGMGYEQSNTPSGVCYNDCCGQNKFIYFETTCNNIGPFNNNGAGFYCDTITGFTGTCRTGTIARTFQSYTFCPDGNGYRLDTQTISVVDTTAPYLGIPADVTVECGSALTLAVTGMTYAYDRCDTAPPTVTPVDTPTNVPPVAATSCSGTVARAFTAADNCGNSQTQTQTITVVDTLPPTFTSVPQDATFECADQVPSPLITATAADVCQATVTVTPAAPTPINVVCRDNFVQPVIYTASDGGCATSTHTTTYTIKDTQPPVISGLVDGAYATAICRPAPLTTTAIDNCPSMSHDTPTPIYTERVEPVVGRIGVFDLRRKATVSDVCGNTATVEDLVRYTQSYTYSIGVSPTTVSPVMAGMTYTVGVTVTWSGLCAGALPDTFFYFEPYPFQFQGATGGVMCDQQASPVGGEVRCVLGISGAASSITSTVSLLAPAWLVTAQEWKINFGVASEFWANTNPATEVTVVFN